jgi:hypothetical protein
MPAPGENNSGKIAIGATAAGLAGAGILIWLLTQKPPTTPPPGKAGTKLTIAVDKTSIDKGQSILITGTLVDSNSVPIVDKLFINQNGFLTEFGTTDASGKASKTIQLNTAGTNTFTLTYFGDASHAGVTTPTITVIVKGSSSQIVTLTLESEKTTFYYGEQTVFTGTLMKGSTPIAGAPITLEMKDSAGRIQYAQTATATDGSYQVVTRMLLSGVLPGRAIVCKAMYGGGGNVTDALTGIKEPVSPEFSQISAEITVTVLPVFQSFGFIAIDGDAQPIGYFGGETRTGSRFVVSAYNSAYVTKPGWANSVYVFSKTVGGSDTVLFQREFSNDRPYFSVGVNAQVDGLSIYSRDTLGLAINAIVEPMIHEVDSIQSQNAHFGTPVGTLYSTAEFALSSAVSVGSLAFSLVNKSSQAMTITVGYRQTAGGSVIPLYTETISPGRRNSLQSASSSTTINGVKHQGGTLRQLTINGPCKSLVISGDVQGISEVDMIVEYV